MKFQSILFSFLIIGWDSKYSANRNKPFGIKDLILTRSSSSKTTENVSTNITSATLSLPLESNVVVNIDLNLPIKGNVAAVVTLFPLKVLIAQIGSLVASSIMKILAPIFVDALLRDYTKRKHLLTDV